MYGVKNINGCIYQPKGVIFWKLEMSIFSAVTSVYSFFSNISPMKL